MTIEEAMNILNLQHGFDLAHLKLAYRDLIKKWHPDLNPKRIKKATEMCQTINAAYDLLESMARSKWGSDQKWSSHVQENLPKWEKIFKFEWRNAYAKALVDEQFPGLHFNTCIENFRRGFIEPRPEWFLHCLFKDSPQDRLRYRELLLKIAPNPTMKEIWARKYFLLEFGEGWVFYLPPGRALLTA